jgi:hypothetical protein
MSPVIDWTVRFGDLISFGGFVIGGLAVIFMMKNDIKAVAMKVGFLTKEVDKQSTEISKLGAILTTMSAYEERFISLQRQIDGIQRQAEDMRHGRGFISTRENGK